MKVLDTSRCALCVSIAVAMFAGCGGSQPPIAAPTTMPQDHAITTLADRGGSWMLPEAKSEDLLYFSNPYNNTVYVFAYPEGRFVGELSGLIQPAWECTDKRGDVFITNRGPSGGSIVEYAHGGTTPIRTLNDSDYPNSCSVDPSTGNLAVVDHAIYNVRIYRDAKGSPKTYTDPSVIGMSYCAYDNKGNLYVSAESKGFTLALIELARGSSSFTNITVNAGNAGSPLQWWHGDLILGAVDTEYYPWFYYLYQVKLSGSSGTVVGTSTLTLSGENRFNGGPFWIQGNAVVVPGDRQAPWTSDAALWAYPAGGKPIKAFKHNIPDYEGLTLAFVTISLAPHP